MQKFLFLLIFMFSFVLRAETIILTDQNTLSLNEEVTAKSMSELTVKLISLNKIETSEPIYLVLSTPGGSVYDGLDFIRYARTSRRPISTITIFAASMGFQMVQGMPGKRYMVSYSTLMSHRVKSSGGGTVEIPGSADTRHAHLLSHINEQDEYVVARTNGKFTLETYKELIRDEYWANSKRAIFDGFADAEVSVTCDESLSGSTFKDIDVQVAVFSVEFANCPMITTILGAKVKGSLSPEKENEALREFKKKYGF